MLRVSPDGRVVWVQTSGTNENYVLDADSLAILNRVPVGVDPEQSAFQPNGGPYGLIAHLTATFLVVLSSATGDVITRIEVGNTQGNVSFLPDGSTAFVTLNDAAQVAVVDMSHLAIVDRIPVGAEPLGLAVFDPASAAQPDRGGSR